jgi:uncharacterized membrane protein (DUF373 family)
MKRLLEGFVKLCIDDRAFLKLLKGSEGIVARLTALAMLLVIFALTYEVGWVVYHDLIEPPIGRLGIRLIELFGLFLNVLIALEILENITAYLKTHLTSQIVELVVVTALVAVARKLIVLDVDKANTVDKLFALGFALITLALSYWIVHHLNLRQQREMARQKHMHDEQAHSDALPKDD